jgi:VIT1/CCC1 family predicted Fe2+/Mn2+ transporter
MGYMRGYILKRNKLAMIAQSVGIGTLCAGVAYLVGNLIGNAI